MLVQPKFKWPTGLSGGKLVCSPVSFQTTALKPKSRTEVWGCAGTPAWQSNDCCHRRNLENFTFRKFCFQLQPTLTKVQFQFACQNMRYISARATGKIKWTFEEIVWFDQNGCISTCQMPKKHSTLTATAAALCQYLHLHLKHFSIVSFKSSSTMLYESYCGLTRVQTFLV